jgi:hypothetical protein
MLSARPLFKRWRLPQREHVYGGASEDDGLHDIGNCPGLLVRLFQRISDE